MTNSPGIAEVVIRVISLLKGGGVVPGSLLFLQEFKIKNVTTNSITL
jgi:hypothetical protein